MLVGIDKGRDQRSAAELQAPDIPEFFRQFVPDEEDSPFVFDQIPENIIILIDRQDLSFETLHDLFSSFSAMD